MGDSSGIQWTERTWNPWQGCERVSPGCDNCYMFREMRRYGKNPDVVVRSSARTFNRPLAWERAALACIEKAITTARTREELVDWGPRTLVFLASWSDFFIKDADPWRAEAWGIIKRCPSLVFQILTKRHARIAKNLPSDWLESLTAHRTKRSMGFVDRLLPDESESFTVDVMDMRRGYPNVALGITAEDQEWADRRWAELARIPARWRFISHEPALGPLSIADLVIRTGIKPDWIITGGESNPGARPYNFDWARQLIDEGRMTRSH